MKTKMILKRSISVLAVLLTACSNVFTDVSNRSTDDALYVDAVTYIDASNFSAAIEKFEAMSDSYQLRPDVLEDWVGALAGKCGLNFIEYTEDLGAANLGGSTFFKWLMNAWTGKAVDPVSCTAAEEKLKLLWTIQTSTQSQKLFMAILSLVKMGTYLRWKGDIDGTGNLGDNTIDAAFDACVSTDDSNHLTDDQVKEVVTGLALFLLNVTDFTASFGDVGNATTAINTACGLLSPNPCSTTDAANVTAGMVNSMRDLMDSVTTGVGSCVDVPPTTCCP